MPMTPRVRIWSLPQYACWWCRLQKGYKDDHSYQRIDDDATYGLQGVRHAYRARFRPLQPRHTRNTISVKTVTAGMKKYCNLLQLFWATSLTKTRTGTEVAYRVIPVLLYKRLIIVHICAMNCIWCWMHNAFHCIIYKVPLSLRPPTMDTAPRYITLQDAFLCPKGYSKPGSKPIILALS